MEENCSVVLLKNMHLLLSTLGLINDQKLIIHKAYGSAKDITVYSSLGLLPDDIFVVGKPPSGKRQSAATYLSEGYADHLAQLTAHGGSRPAQGNARMVIPRYESDNRATNVVSPSFKYAIC